MFDDSAEDIRSFYANHSDNYIITDWITGIAVIFFFIPFLVVLRRIFTAVDPSGIWAGVFYTSGLLFAALGGASSAFDGAATVNKGDQLSPEFLRGMLVAGDYSFSIAVIALAAMHVAAALVIGRTGVLWRWIAALNVISAVCILIGSLGNLSHDSESGVGFLVFIGLIGTMLFALIAGINMIMRGMKGTAGETLMAERATPA
jgi:hypothetical protein